MNLLDQFRKRQLTQEELFCNQVYQATNRVSMDDFLKLAERFRAFNLSVEEITDAIRSACDFFGIPFPSMVLDLTNEPGGQTMFVNYDRSSYEDDIICYNIKQLQALGVRTKDAFSLVMTHECAHRFYQATPFPGRNNGAWEQELSCDFFMGVRSALQHLDIQPLMDGFRGNRGAASHPDGALRIWIMEQGQHTVSQFVAQHIEFTLSNLSAACGNIIKALQPTIYAHQEQI